MSSENFFRRQLAPFTFCLVFLLALALGPGLLRKTNHVLVTEASNQPALLYLSHPLTIITSPEPSRVRKGAQVTLEQLMQKSPKGLIVNFWATWCPPCIEEMPSLEYLHRQMEQKGAEMPTLVTISVDSTTAEVRQLLPTLDFKSTFWVLHDPDGAYAGRWGTLKFPETYWVGASGKIVNKWIGPQDWLSKSILDLLKSSNQD